MVSFPHRVWLVALALGWTLVLCTSAGCGQENEQVELTADEMNMLQTLGPLPEPPPSPTNAVADDAQAAALGRQIFFDTRMSSDGEVGCVSCHLPSLNFADPRAIPAGVERRRGARHAPSLVNASFHMFYFWDGRADSLWSQALQAIEGPDEMDFTRTEVAHFIATNYRDRYEAVFGPLPDLSEVPPRAKPGDDAWRNLPAAQQRQVNEIFANVGKVLEAFERRIVCDDTRLDRYLRGDPGVELSNEERLGARVFVRSDRGRCRSCHFGADLSDNLFHNIGIPQKDLPLDLGRYTGVPELLEDPFNGIGEFSDDPQAGQLKLAHVEQQDWMKGAFRTSSLRGISQHPPYGHAGNIYSLEDWIDFHARGGGDPQSDRFAGQKTPSMRSFELSAKERQALVSFLHTLDCPPFPDEVIGPSQSP